ncbi:HAMP domain-containing histidine kinase [Nocardioides sp. cx-169]|uniref:sensor histidine kinase n=1 Tax=Nocardioides sp. cx-169 TaxID=2899080 RepID=UPI001E5824C7|nr:HAMP domain-containing sensor histidine kinase [Nocardioides sp. cx-169]MCD4533431.1 HAMP domain-containing histidine kinase [Nocardioides sp. cx-169]
MALEPVGMLASDRAGWSDALSRDALRLIAEAVREMAGFQVAAVSVVRGDDLHSVAIAGSDEARAALWDAVTPMQVIRDELAKADDWGRFKFVPSERAGAVDEWGWVPAYEPADDDEAWDPRDLLLAPLYDDDARLVGLLSIDLPTSGRRPDARQRALLERYAAHAERTVLVALERHDFSEQIRLATTAREIVRSLSVHLPIEELLEQCGAALSAGFRAGGSWVQTFAGDVLGSGALHSARGAEIVLPDLLIEVAEEAAHQLWAAQQWVVIERDLPVQLLTSEQSGLIHLFMERIEAASLLFVPIGAGASCVGNLVLTRVEGQPPWGRTEAEAALDIGHDLGRSILNARTFAREHRLVQELTALDQYKGRLIATVAHELKSPLTAVVGHLEMAEAAPELSETTRRSLAAMDRGAQRLQRVIDDLLLFSKVGDPDSALIAVPVPLQPVLEELAELHTVAARRAGVTIRLETPEEPVGALGEPEEIDTALGNVLGNAVKYGRPDTVVTVSLARERDDAVVTVRDQGIGISLHDQAQLFDEFYRSADPAALAQPGTGLGLAIVRRIVDRHSGSVTVTSELGVGSTFTLRLPAAPA